MEFIDPCMELIDPKCGTVDPILSIDILISNINCIDFKGSHWNHIIIVIKSYNGM